MCFALALLNKYIIHNSLFMLKGPLNSNRTTVQW